MATNEDISFYDDEVSTKLDKNLKKIDEMNDIGIGGNEGAVGGIRLEEEGGAIKKKKNKGKNRNKKTNVATVNETTLGTTNDMTNPDNNNAFDNDNGFNDSFVQIDDLFSQDESDDGNIILNEKKGASMQNGNEKQIEDEAEEENDENDENDGIFSVDSFYSELMKIAQNPNVQLPDETLVSGINLQNIFNLQKAKMKLMLNKISNLTDPQINCLGSEEVLEAYFTGQKRDIYSTEINILAAIAPQKIYDFQGKFTKFSYPPLTYPEKIAMICNVLTPFQFTKLKMISEISSGRRPAGSFFYPEVMWMNTSTKIVEMPTQLLSTESFYNLPQYFDENNYIVPAKKILLTNNWKMPKMSSQNKNKIQFIKYMSDTEYEKLQENLGEKGLAWNERQAILMEATITGKIINRLQICSF